MTLDEINKVYNDETFPILPYIDENAITIIKKGIYRKKNATFRGVTARFNVEKCRYEFPVYGVYIFKKDTVLVPTAVYTKDEFRYTLNEFKKSGYDIVRGKLKFKTYLLDPNSKEAKAALENNLLHRTTLK